MRGLWDLGRILSACLLIVTLVPSAAGAAPAEGMDSGLNASQTTGRVPGPADGSIRLARQYSAAGDWSSADAVLRAARDLDGNDSDVRYLLAIAILKTSDDAQSALAELEAGLAAHNYYYYTADDLILLDASLLVRMRRYSDALTLLSPASAANGGGIKDGAAAALSGMEGGTAGSGIVYESADRRLLRIKALFGIGGASERKSAFSEIAEAAKLYPADARFAGLFFRNADRAARENTQIEDLASLFLGRLYELADAEPGLRLLAIPFMPDEASRRDSILAYRAMGGSRAESCLPALEYGIIDDSACVEELFSSGSIARADLDRLKGLLRNAQGLSAFESALKNYSGRIYRDEDADDYPEEWGRYSKGLLTEFYLDSDQNGMPELHMQCREGLPVSAELRRPGFSLDIDYSRYPYVQSFRRLLADGQTEADYRFGPGSYIYKPVLMEPYPDAQNDLVYLGRALPVFDPVERAAAACALSVARLNGRYRDVYILNAGIILRRERYIEGRLAAVLNYDNGRPGLEKLDSDGDGRYETERIYRPDGDGGEDTILSLRVDTNGDGLFDYSEELSPPYLKRWDFDYDGLMDAEQRNLADGKRERRFSSHLNGVFDELLVVSATGMILNFERDGRKLAFVPDSNPRLKWIGRKDFDLGSNLPPLEGIYRYKGKRYRLLYVNGEAFAELVE